MKCTQKRIKIQVTKIDTKRKTSLYIFVEINSISIHIGIYSKKEKIEDNNKIVFLLH